MLIGNDYTSRHNNVPVVSAFPIHPEILQGLPLRPPGARGAWLVLPAMG